MGLVESLQARWEIEQVLYRYCVLVDERDWEAMSSVFTSDTVGDYNGLEVIGLAKLVDQANANMVTEKLVATQHNISNPRIQINSDGKGAHVISNYYAVHYGGEEFEGQLYSMWGEYDDIFVLNDDGWRIKHRTYRTAFTQGDDRMVWDGGDVGWDSD
ncbi:MAG: 3-phenylpropionate/cinnamic acid dioxygenase small subunit [Paracoccaceae bacterium]|jgi:3-phenylpropionate/cinnamic acid dioxygenase small subunit